MNDHSIQDLISKLGFAPELLDSHLWVKKFPAHANYQLCVDFQNKKILYSKPLIVGDETTSHFAAPENFVVLECIDRLLAKGYAPQHLELERRYKLGHSGKSGKADITVYDRENRALVVIECKTWGEEYEKELKRLYADGGQLFSYLKQDGDIRWLCLYASHFDGHEVESLLSLIQIEDRPEVLELLKTNPDELAYQSANDAKKLHEVWRDQYSAFSTPNGLFDAEVSAYEPKKIAIKRRDLKPFTSDEGRRFFNEFAEILRHNNISDKSNAFNRILSLILCKIVDEQKQPDEVTDFQIADIKESAEAIQDRLQKLYADGMGRFLKESIVYYSDDQIQAVMKDFPRQFAKDKIAAMFRAQKYYSNNEFAFKEVHNQKLFLENARVLNEILQLLQFKQFRYARRDVAEYKAQKRYLGEFFELLLAAGYKQDEGQFFTPLPIAHFIVSSLPIAHFIVSSLPLSDIVARKLAAKEADFLPTVMDYACGSGHFLIEAIDQIQTHLDALQTNYSDEINHKILHWQEGDWTDGFIFGVEKDYRLARTAKLACFMNGDGQALIKFGDGLEDYCDESGHFPKTFDVVVANPPYSIKGFKTHTQQSLKRNSFELMDALSPNASEIEVLFIERLAQLLHPGGVCGVILPSSILSNTGIYSRARALLLRAFEVRAIVEFGNNTFMATGTNTVTLFLKRREAKHAENAALVAEDFILHHKKRLEDFRDNAAILEAYALALGFSLADYQTVLARHPSDAIGASDWWQERRARFESSNDIKKLRASPAFKAKDDTTRGEEIERRFYTDLLPVEREKFEFFQLIWEQKTLVVRAPSDTNERREFLGYEFKGGKGHEGIFLYEKDGAHQNALYSENDLEHPDKLNFLVRRMLVFATLDYNAPAPLLPIVPDALNATTRLVSLLDCFGWTRIDFEKQINLSVKRVVESKYEMKRLGIVCDVKIGGTPDRNRRDFYEGGHALWISIGEMNGQIIADTKEKINDAGIKASNVKLVKAGTTLVSFKLSIGKTAVAGADLYTNEAIAALEIQEKFKDQVLDKYLFLIFNARFVDLQAEGSKAFGNSLNSKHLREEVKIPVPPIKVQESIISEIEAIESDEAKDKAAIEAAQMRIDEVLQVSFASAPRRKLADVATLERGRFNHRPRNAPFLYEGGSLPFIQTGDVAQALGKPIKAVQFLNEQGAAVSKLFAPGTIFITIAANIGCTAILDFPAYAPDSIVGITPHETTINVHYLEHFLRTQQSYLEAIAPQNAQKNINLQTLQPLLVSVPPIPEQEITLAAIQAEAAIIAEAQARLKDAPARKAAVLTKYL